MSFESLKCFLNQKNLIFEFYISGLNYTWAKLISPKRKKLKKIENEMIFGVFIFAVNEKKTKIKLEDFYFLFFNVYYSRKKTKKKMIKNLYFLSKIYNQIWLNRHTDTRSLTTLPYLFDMIGTFGYKRKKKNSSKKIHGHEWTGQKNTSIIASRVSIFTTTFNTTGFLECGSLEVAPTHPPTLEHQPLWHILGPSVCPSVRLIISCFSLLLLTPHLEVLKKSIFFFFPAARPGTPHSGPGTPTYKCDEEPCNE
jgi:hypothetical protein